MINRFVKIAIYFLFVFFVTYLVVMYAEANKVVDFLRDLQTEIEDDPQKLISATLVANNHNGTEVYVKKEPLFIETFESTTNNRSVTVSIYGVVEFRDDDAHNAIIIMLTDLDLQDDDAYLDNDDYNVLNANIKFDQSITINDYTSTTFYETFANSYSDSKKMILLNTKLFESNGSTANFERIDITYRLSNETDITLVTLYNEENLTITLNDSFDASYDRDISGITSNQMDILNQYGLTNLESNSEIYYNPEFNEVLNTYNSYYFRFAIYELIFVAPLTYFVFFHKNVKKQMEISKKVKIRQQKERQETLKQAFRDKDKN